jgi:hypothetical protein
MQQGRTAAVTGIATGAALMYLLDPDRGRRRRALLRDKMTRAAHTGTEAMGVAGRDLAHRTTGAAARLRRAVSHEPVDDDVLAERVRAQLGRYVSHPRALEVSASGGVVTLRGPILASEAPRLLRAVERIRGVREIAPELQEHTTQDIPALQGGTPPAKGWGNIWPGRWSPATRLLTGGVATLAAVAVARNGSLTSSRA